MILIFTANEALAQGLVALTSTIANILTVTTAKTTAAALRAVAQGGIDLVILDGGLSMEELIPFLRARAAAALFPPVLFLMEGMEQEEVARREQVMAILKGSTIGELIATIEMLLNLAR